MLLRRALAGPGPDTSGTSPPPPRPQMQPPGQQRPAREPAGCEREAAAATGPAWGRLTCRDLSYQRLAPFLLQPPPWRSWSALLVSLSSMPPGASRHTRQMQRSIISRESLLVESAGQASTALLSTCPAPGLGSPLQSPTCHRRTHVWTPRS